jgi:uncharacterized LabA/DUF88 family protein
MSHRVAIYVDGFNLYHSLVEIAKTSPKANSVKWLDIRSLVNNKMTRKNYSIVSIKYFSALYPNNNKKQKHKKYLRVLEDSGVEIIMGKFKRKDVHCKQCDRVFQTHEEKRTDVNIALHVLNDAYRNSYDTAIIISGDTDLIPAIELVKHNFSSKKVGIYAPNDRSNNELKNVADFVSNIRKHQIEASLFPDSYISSDGKKYTKPEEWK